MKKIFFILFVSILSFYNSYSQDYFEREYSWDYDNLHSSKLLQSEDNGYYLLSYSESFGEYEQQYFFISKIDSDGNRLWQNDVWAGDYGVGFAPADLHFLRIVLFI